MSRLRQALPWILLLTLVVYFGILPRLLLSPLLLRIAASLGVSFDRASSAFLWGSAGFVTGLLTSGFVSHRLRHRATIVVAILMGGAMLIALSFVHSLLAFNVIFAILNWAAGLYPGSGIPSITGLVDPGSRSTALAIHETGPNLAFLTAPIIVALLAPSYGWQSVFRAAGGATFTVGIAFVIFGRASNDRGEPPRFHSIADFLRSGPFWIVSALFVLAASGAMGVFAVLPTYLVLDHGLSEQLVNTLVGFSRVTGFASILLAGTLADRYGFRRVVLVILGTTGLVTIAIGLLEGVPLMVAVFLQPLLVGAFFPLGLSALSTVFPPERQNLAVALAIPLANLIGSGLMPRVLAFAGSVGRFDLGFVLLGLLTVASLVLLRWYPVPQSRPG